MDPNGKNGRYTFKDNKAMIKRFFRKFMKKAIGKSANVLVLGGSNSFIRDGYVHHFRQKLLEQFEAVTIVNRAAGATTSLTSIGSIDNIDVDPDIILYEYSLNDGGHLNH
ncbi:hypothetical protein SAMN04515647_3154 [Cohaesibacter sp. ES.047]|uniref:hypothetical protein n=1 Tax=Cohaesibacter sp. ES.047 TaxID=1798205 RepID=UPI000BB860A1|nr:hypothetical protein [Cohaesibacter sp. ES.047]SNY92889.1 hypothetical protein SAMN04515647_3154 [Cohaesibacter sp. ES.047]